MNALRIIHPAQKGKIMTKPSPANVSLPIFTALMGQPTGATLSREDVAIQDLHAEGALEGRATNALRESNREDTQILFKQAGLNKWLNTPYVLNSIMITVLGIAASGLVYLLR